MKYFVILAVVLMFSLNIFAVSKDSYVSLGFMQKLGNFSALNEDITCSLYILKLSHSVQDKTMQDAIGLAYDESIKYIETESDLLADQTVKKLIESDDSMFNEFVESFNSSPTGVKSGYSVLAQCLIEHIKLSGKPNLEKYKEKASC